MKTYLVTVDRLMEDDRVYNTESYRIMAHDETEAYAIVFNNMELHFEPRFRISKVEVYKDE